MTCKEKIDNIEKILDDEYECKIERIREVVESEETTVEPKLEKDGTLVVTTEHYENVGRVLVQHGTSGTLFYQDQEPCEGAKYEEDTNKLKEQILKEGSNLISKRDLLKRFDKVDKEYKGRPWNFLQILANINILIGQEPCEDCVSRKEVEKLCYKFLSKSTDNNVAFFEHIIELPSVKPMQKEFKDFCKGQGTNVEYVKSDNPDSFDTFFEPTEWEQDQKLLKACGDYVDIVLDNIKAEIEQIELLANYTRGDIKRMSLDIINKYKEN